MNDRLEIGCVVYSRKGRDADRYYAVVRVQGEFAFIADGELRKLNNPKKKNVKHIKSNGQVLTSIADKLIKGQKVFDSELKSALRAYNDNGGSNV